MINEAELRRIAAQWKVDPTVVDLDYSLGWFLYSVSRVNHFANRLIFKGGTCLRKCYFGDYRFSEDLDFTCVEYVDVDQLKSLINSVSSWAIEQGGPNFNVSPPKYETIKDEYGSETYRVRVYYRGPLDWGGSPRKIQLDLTRDEKIIQKPEERLIIHPYSDQAVFGEENILAYTLAEILVEKLRAVCGQRRYAISRDIYDIHQLIRSGMDINQVIKMVPEKFASKDMAVDTFKAGHVIQKKDEFEQDWRRNLEYLIPRDVEVDFSKAWSTVVGGIERIQNQLQ
jgi:predicted nucleotidyltransferase component of viral defense system